MAQPLLSYAEAAVAIRDFITARSSAEGTRRRPQLVLLSDALGRVPAEALRADRDQPPFPRSTRDGYACRAVDANTHQFLSLTGHVRAGETAPGTVGPGEVWEIMTGAAVPNGADAVFMLEHVGHSSNSVQLLPPRTIEPGENIVARGAEARSGDLLLAEGARITPAQIALAAQCGYCRLAVAPRPTVAILSTGDELVSVEETPGPNQIRNSNAPMLVALVAAAGGEAISLPAIPDQAYALDEALRRAMDADLLLVSGGISAGRFDLVDEALARAGARFIFRGVAIQPGKPVAFGELPRSGQPSLPFLALPGNPVSSAVTFHLFAAPLLAGLSHDSTSMPRFGLATLSTPWRGKPGLTRFLPALCDFSLAPKVRLVPWQGSGDIAAFSRSNCFAVIPSDAQEVAADRIVQILLT